VKSTAHANGNSQQMSDNELNASPGGPAAGADRRGLRRAAICR
jgi:hypothetical protein